MTIKYHYDLVQGDDAWLQCRCGLLTASEMKHIITPAKLQYASNDKERAHLYELLAQRITSYVEPHYISDDMIRGMADEIDARELYAKNYGEIQEVGFITNDKYGFTIGYSPDALVGDDGVIECKSRRQKYQIETIIGGVMPADYMMQVQTGLLVSERSWCDFISYSAGLPMLTLRVYPDKAVQDAILEAATKFHEKLELMLTAYNNQLAADGPRLIPTERKPPEQEMVLT